MPSLAQIPPGRAGRLWLRRRLTTARRGREQLERKLRVLVDELERREIQLDERRRQWVDACREADAWLLRAGILGGQESVDHAVPADPVAVELEWTTTVGVTCPSDARLVERSGPAGGDPGRGPGRGHGNAAIDPAAAASRRALLAGVRTAAAEEGVRRVQAESVATRRRLRALDKRWLPRLEAALAAVESSLEQAEQEDAARLGRAVGEGRRAAP